MQLTMSTKGAHSRGNVYREMCRQVTLSTLLHTHQPHVYNNKYCWRHIIQPRTRTTFILKMAVIWVVAPCSLAEVYRRFRGTCCLNHQGDMTRPHSATTQKTAIFILAEPQILHVYFFLPVFSFCFQTLILFHAISFFFY
jgi:hypothetical protein